MRLPLVAGNWKMNGSLESTRELASAVAAGATGISGVEIAICPPFVYLAEARAALSGSNVVLGAQNVCDQDSGAFTGEVSPAMLGELDCRFAIVGHSERRQIYGETDELVATRFVAAKRNGLVPVLCVGETLEEREGDRTDSVISRQIDAVLDVGGEYALREAVVAYEPVWAIGTGRTASPEQAQQVHAFIRGRVAKTDADAAEALRILYGGSMKPANAAGLMEQPDVDGGLIGGASLKADDFLAICRAASTSTQ